MRQATILFALKRVGEKHIENQNDNTNDTNIDPMKSKLEMQQVLNNAVQEFQDPKLGLD